ncbi:MAG TPA: carboxypeptidase regulatory-like domain-containing protein [Terracidiphilus sp.]|nr:carboxypeptidase regulatory-like domain-containing protein [Terracidiphilus sp.]
MFLLLASCPLLVRAQELTATLSGVVTDTSGAVIPGATVTVTLNGVNATGRVVQSDAAGIYTITNLPAGTYSVKSTATGFATYEAKNVILNVAEKHTLNVQLKAGEVTTTVTVEDNPVSVDTQTSAQAGTISGQQVRELELSSRNFEQLVTLQPGVANSGLGDEASASNTGLSVNGARADANNWTVDGADINDSGSNATVVNTPSVDAIQEFTLERGSYDAGYGRSGGGQVLVATKSGTSSFHGDLYEFVRNTVFDANDYLTKRNEIANGEPNKNPVNHHNVYGFTIGGPIFIPKVYNTGKTKTFFFWSEDWHKLTTPGSDTMPAASQAQLSGVVAGNFTNGPSNCFTYDSASDTTTISPSCYSANSQVYLTNVFSKYPANDGSNYFFSYSAKNDIRDDIVRVDHYFNDKVHFYARGMNDVMPNNQPEGLWAGSNYPGLVNTTVDSPGKNVVGNLTWAISPKIVNEVEFVWAQGTYHSTIESGQFATSASIISDLTPGTEVYPDPYGRVPNVSISGITGFSSGSAPWKERNLDRTYFDNLSFSFGKHTLRTGFQIQQMLKSENAVTGNPNYSFNSWGDFLLGNVASFSQASRDVIPDLHYINSEAYVQDDWKLNNKLTINLGLRWSYFPSVTDVNNTLLAFDPLLYSASNAPVIDPSSGDMVPGPANAANYANGLIFPTGKACSYATSNALYAQCSPYGAYVNPNDKANFGPRLGFAYNPDGRSINVIRGGFGIFYDRVLNGIWEQNAFANPVIAPSTNITNGSFDAIQGSGTVSGPSYGPAGLTSTGTPTFSVPRYANYSLSVERQLLPSTTLEVAYVGNVARHLVGEFDQNQPTVAAWQAANPNPSTDPNDPDYPTTNVNALRPYLGYAGISARAPLYTSNYNSLQVSLSHRSSKGLTVGVAYTWSKSLTTSSGDRANGSFAARSTDSYDLRMDYGPSTANTPQIFEANYIYDLPFFKQQHGFEGKLLGGWELSGITSMVSGQSFSVSQTYDPFNPAGSNNSVGIGISGARPDQIAPVHMTKKIDQWFTTSSFAPAAYHFGSEGSNSLLGPGLQNWDLAAIKNISFAERYKFQLRGEFFNAFNHTNYSSIDTSMADGASFGTVNGVHVPRRIQLGAKFYF